MALDQSDRSQLEAHIGPIDEDDMPDMSARLDRLGLVEAVALEVLRTRLSQIRMTPAEFSAQGDARISTAKNVAWIQEAINDLVEFMAGLSLNADAQALVDAVKTSKAATGTTGIDVVSYAPRKG